MSETACGHCGKMFRPNPRAGGLYCGRPCWYAALKANKPEVRCERCGVTFRTKPANIRMGKARFCSRDCSVPALAEEKTKTLAERFWEKVRKGEGCWEWTASKDVNGYGRLMVKGDDGRYVPTLAHRISYELAHGPIDPTLFVCHVCDHPSCVNPSHLFLGDAKANMQDCSTKRRTTFGERSSSARLGEAEVVEIRRRYAVGGVTYAGLGKAYGVGPATIADVIVGRTWKHVI